MIRVLALAVTLAALGAPPPARAESQPAKVDPVQQALVQMLQEAQGREAQALVQIYSLKAQIGDLQSQLAEQTRRADEAQGKTKPEPPAAAR